MATLNVKNRTLFSGDNVDVLRGINSECVDLIYLDPPFDSNRTYEAPIGSEAAGAAFKDTWTLVTLQDIWADIGPISSRSKERIGDPTQKPLALLERIIKARSNEGDVVLDPFCGCATALAAAETLNRQWIGIDLSSLAVQLVLSRLQKAADDGALLASGWLPEVHHRTQTPRRTDVGKLPPYKTHRHTLYGQQEGRCAGCRHHFPFRNLTVDHIVAKSKGGTDHIDNLQLLCGACNSMKGTIRQAAFHAKLTKQGLR